MEKNELIKSRFRSRSEHTLDPKGRFNFPRRFKDVLLEYYGSSDLMLTTWGTCLRAYPATEWQIIEDKLLSKGREEPNLSRFIRHVVSGITECSLDKQSRLLIPTSLRSEVGIDKEVTLTGMLEFIEIWDKRAWLTEYDLARKNLEQYNDSLANIGIL
ncbi:MAG: division/cell wall cluster transcriptional repressor MraZ [Desulfobacterales bacterium]|nr:division/cell wall cluster transcriptional repressor MraZ [Deltaproteobacteria bacterium]MBT8362976.1 division/cell wall cluster transcriptional repressor MraZ [Deltaproteobacteria bacterium]NNK12667.1 division/cell wall cluster transcriptional repressor MraZ [Desulfofustis sp.]NNK96166.1 division/cell wall cluster transcriptional repressor MraZ [Desulfobacterales bacterium]